MSKRELNIFRDFSCAIGTEASIRIYFLSLIPIIITFKCKGLHIIIMDFALKRKRKHCE